MSLNAWERRELAEIEQSLRLADPRLAGLLAAPVGPGNRFVQRLANAFLAVAVLLIVSGLLLADGDMVTGGCLVLGMMPITVCLVAAAQRRAP
ncbi:MAG TPA: DUF3040 domain-containing protein [Mycobacterium sp.]|nr:DUF3040 domain-containing protein [Mycobacterium sp.]